MVEIIKNSNDVWHSMLRIKNNPKTPEDSKKVAEMLLGQYNTSGGRRITSELEFFIQNNKRYNKTIKDPSPIHEA